MGNQESNEHASLLERFQSVSGNEGTIRYQDFETVSVEYQKALSDLFARFGHDELTQNYIMLGLDELQDRKPLQTIRRVTLGLVHQAHVLQRESLTDSPRAQGFERMEKRLALLWRHQLAQDEATSREVKLQEINGVRHHSASKVLKEQLPYLLNQL